MGASFAFHRRLGDDHAGDRLGLGLGQRRARPTAGQAEVGGIVPVRFPNRCDYHREFEEADEDFSLMLWQRSRRGRFAARATCAPAPTLSGDLCTKSAATSGQPGTNYTASLPNRLNAEPRTSATRRQHGQSRRPPFLWLPAAATGRILSRRPIRTGASWCSPVHRKPACIRIPWQACAGGGSDRQPAVPTSTAPRQAPATGPAVRTGRPRQRGGRTLIAVIDLAVPSPVAWRRRRGRGRGACAVTPLGSYATASIWTCELTPLAWLPAPDM